MAETIVGHVDELERLNHLIQEGAVPHALCFAGVKGIGKRMVAQQVLDALSGGEYHRHPDKWEITREINPKTKALKKLISVEQIRGLKDQLSRTSLSGGKKLVLIDEAETLSIAAQNSLLKTLEEPAGDTHIILITSELGKLLPTIQSRCEIMRFKQLTNQQVKEVLELNLVQNDLEMLVELSHGNPSRALELAQIDLESELGHVEEFLLTGVALRFARIGELTKKKDKPLLYRRLRLYRMVLRELLELQLNPARSSGEHFAKLATRYREQPISRTTRALAILSDIETAINKNCSPAIALEHFALSL